MAAAYEPKLYWEQRLSNRFTLGGVGHIGFTDTYNGWLYRRKRTCLKFCLKKINLEGKKVLDIGCGTGFFVGWYLGQGAAVTGVDITQVSIDRLRQKYPQSELMVQDITDPAYDLGNGQFDIVNMWDVVYHIVDPLTFRQAFANIARSIKDGGYLLFTDWFGAPSDKRIADHVQGRCLATYRNLLPQMGFELRATYPLYHYLNTRHLGRLDNRLGAFYYLLDGLSAKMSAHNISLSLWRYNRKTSV